MRAASAYALLAVAGRVVASGGAGPDDEPIPLQEVRQCGVEGKLGARPGTVVEISGEVVPNDSRSKADSATPSFLSITAVNGRALDEPVRYPLAAHEFAKVPEPRVGDTFRDAGYETGGFFGPPEGEFDHVPGYATTGYGFDTQFVVLARP